MIPGLRIGRYEVAECLGKGAFGVVHAARDGELGREVAIKFLKPEYLGRDEVVQRFLQEARAAAMIGHPGIVTVFECGLVSGTGRIDGTAFIVMERLHGESLEQRLKRSGRMPIQFVISLGRQLATTLRAAHEAGIVHRDLKPDNVFLVPDAAVVGGERAKILDFGIAKLDDPGPGGVQTHTKTVMGTPRYMPPEQARSAARVDARSDVYSLGCMLYELVCGRAPFEGPSVEIILQHQGSPIVPPRELMENVPEALDALIVNMLAKTPEQRPSSMQQVDDRLAMIVAPPQVPAMAAPMPKAAPPVRAAVAETEVHDVDDDDEDEPTSADDDEDEPTSADDDLPTATDDDDDDRTIATAPLVTATEEMTVPRLPLETDQVAGLRPSAVTPLLTPVLDPEPPTDPHLAGFDVARGSDLRSAEPPTEPVLPNAPVYPRAMSRDPRLATEAVRPAGDGLPRKVYILIAIGGVMVLLALIIALSSGGDDNAPPDAALAPAIDAARAIAIDARVIAIDAAAPDAAAADAAVLIDAAELPDAAVSDEGARVPDSPDKPAKKPRRAPDPPLTCTDRVAVSAAEARGDQLVMQGSFAAAVAQFERVLPCAPTVIQKAYLAACRAKSFAAAKRYFRRLSSNRDGLAQICLKEGFDPRTP